MKVVAVTKNKKQNARNYSELGVGWKMFDDGTINITLHPGVCIDWRMCDDYYISIKPINNG